MSANNDKKTQYDLDYAKNKLKRVPLDLQLSDYNALKEIALANNLPINRYIKEAIALKASTDGFEWPTRKECIH